MALFLPFIESLNRAGVQYVVVGGLATVLHGYPRFTADIGMVIGLDADNAGRAITALEAEGYVPRVPVDPRRFVDPAERERWAREKGLVVRSFVHRDNPLLIVDIFAEYPMDFPSLLAGSIDREIGGVPVRICSIDHLIQMKRRVGRAKDLADVEALEKLRHA